MPCAMEAINFKQPATKSTNKTSVKNSVSEFIDGSKGLVLGPEEVTPEMEYYSLVMVFGFMILWAVFVNFQVVSPSYELSIGGIELPPYP